MAAIVRLRAAAVATLVLGALSRAHHGPPVTRVAQPDALEAVVRATNNFSVDLYHALLKDTKGNLQVSPLNVAAALAAVSQGARDSTAAQIAEVLHLDPRTPPSRLADGFQMLLEAFNSTKANMLEIASRMFAEVTSGVSDHFLQLAERTFNTHVQLLDFRHKPTEAGGTVVTWLEARTHYRVSVPLEQSEFGSDTMLLLGATSYLQTTWERRYFRTEDTRWAPFFAVSGRSRYSRFMHCTATFLYAEVDNAKVIELPLAGGRIAMWIVLPAKKDGLPEIEKDFDLLDLSNLPRLAYQNVILSLPRFQLHNSIKLKQALKKLGLVDIFSDGANLAGMTDGRPDLKVNNVVQRSFLEVSERGDSEEEAVATRKSGEREFNADHPFLVIVRDSTTGTILLLGRVADIK